MSLTLVKLSGAFKIEVFKPLPGNNNVPDGPETGKMKRFAQALTLALDVSTAEAAKIFEIEVYELLKPEKEDDIRDSQTKNGQVKAWVDRLSPDLTVV